MLLKEENPSELNFFYIRKGTYQFFFPYSLCCLIDKASASKAGDCWYESHQRKSILRDSLILGNRTLIIL